MSLTNEVEIWIIFPTINQRCANYDQTPCKESLSMNMTCLKWIKKQSMIFPPLFNACAEKTLMCNRNVGTDIPMEVCKNLHIIKHKVIYLSPLYL